MCLPRVSPGPISRRRSAEECQSVKSQKGWLGKQVLLLLDSIGSRPMPAEGSVKLVTK